MPLGKQNRRAKKIESDFRRENGNIDFSNKEVYLLLLDNIDKKLDEHLKWANKLVETYVPLVTKQGEILQHVCEGLPDKGFCGKVDKMYADLYPDKEIPLHEKVNTLWYDRKILKWLLATTIGTLITVVITLLVGFIKGVF